MILPLTIIRAENYTAFSNNPLRCAAGLSKAIGSKTVLFHSFQSLTSFNDSEVMRINIEKAALRFKVLALEINSYGYEN